MSEETELKKINDSIELLSFKMECFLKEMLDEQKKSNEWLKDFYTFGVRKRD